MSPPVLAYQNDMFIDGAEGRPIRILSEYLQPLAALRVKGIRDAMACLHRHVHIEPTLPCPAFAHSVTSRHQNYQGPATNR